MLDKLNAALEQVWRVFDHIWQMFDRCSHCWTISHSVQHSGPTMMAEPVPFGTMIHQPRVTHISPQLCDGS